MSSNRRWVLWALVAALVVVSQVGPLARVIAGETPGCPWDAKVAAAHVHANRLEAGIEGGWFGDAEPGMDDWLAATWWRYVEDPTGGALFFIGPGDRERMPWLRMRVGRWLCAGTWVEAWE